MNSPLTTDSQDWLKFLAHESGTSLWQIDLPSMHVHPLAREVYLGFAPGEIPDSLDGWLSLLHPDDLQSVQQHLYEIMEGKTDKLHFEHRARHRNGSWRWLRTSIVVKSKLPDGKPAAILGATTEVTYPRHVERVLHLGRTMLEQLARPAPLPQTLQRLVSVVLQAIEKGWVAILLVDETDGQLKLVAETGLPAPYRRLLSGEDANLCTGNCLTTFNKSVLKDISLDPWCDYCHAAARASGIRACHAFPLFSASGDLLGKLVLYFADPQVPSHEEHEVLTSAAQMAIVAIEHSRNQQSLQRSQERFRLLAETVRVVPWEWSPKTRRFTYVGPQAEQLFGYPLSAWKADHFWEGNIHPDELAGILAQCAREVINKPNYLLEYRFRAANGEWIWVHDIVTVERQEGVPVVLRGFMIDITTMRAIQSSLLESESRLRSITECAPDYIMQIDRQHRIQFINHTMHPITKEQTLGTSVESWLIDAYKEPSFERIEQAFRTGLPQQYETHFVNEDGKVLAFSTRVGPIKVGDGPIESAVLIAHDVTDLRRAEEALRERDTQLAHAERLNTMGQMATELAHEINQPLYAIANFADACNGALERINSDDLKDVRDWLQKIGVQSRRASEIVQRINHFVRKEEGERTSFCLNDAARNVVPLFELMVRRDQLQLTLDLTPNLPRVHADRLLIEQVLTNLIRNALESIRNAKTENGRVLVRSYRLRADQVAIAVIDNGPGISDKIQGQLFEPYFTTKTDGTGMGLAICRSAIEAHGGQIWGMNQPGGGAMFQFTLPIDERSWGGAAR